MWNISLFWNIIRYESIINITLKSKLTKCYTKFKKVSLDLWIYINTYIFQKIASCFKNPIK